MVTLLATRRSEDDMNVETNPDPGSARTSMETRRGTRLSSTRMRTVVAGVGLAVLGGSLAACSPGGSASTTASAGSTTFVVARTGDINELDPQLATAFQTVQTLGLVYSTLVNTSATGQIEPGLATAWTTSPDGRTVTFTLRSGVTWQDGSAFTSADVKASIERILDQSTSAVARSNLLAISGVDTPSATSVVLHLSQPSAALLYTLAATNTSIESAKAIQAGTVGKTPDGTGPFSWKEWDQGQQVVLTANPTYYGGAPKIKTLEFRVIPSESTILSGMQAGTFQLGQLSDPGVVQQVGSSGSGFSVDKEPSLSYNALMLNARRGPLQNEQVRQAISCVIDRNQVLQTAAYGDGTVTGPITSPAFSSSATAGLACTPGDTAKAKQMLAAAGYPKGFTLNTIVETGEYATAAAQAQNLQSQLAAIGVTLKLQQLSTSPYVTAWLAANYDAALALNGGSFDPYLMYGRYFGTDGSLSAPAGLTSPALATLLAQGNATTDTAQRQAIYANLQKELLTESPWVWLYSPDDFYLVASGVQGFTPRPDELLTSLASAS
jgi:peptide/nickel transport system substrate-binding protein